MKMLKLWMKMNAVFLFFLCLALPAEAAVTVTEREGNLLITYPNGETQLVNEGDNLGDLPPQTILEVIDGKITLKTEEGDNVVAKCFGYSANFAGGASGSVTCKADNHFIVPIQGVAVIVSPSGEQTVLEGSGLGTTAEESMFNIPDEAVKEAQTLPPTQEGNNNLGGDETSSLVDENTPVDSRDIQASPSR